MEDLQQASNWGTFKKAGTWYRVSCTPYRSWNGKENPVSSPLDHQKLRFPKPGKYFIINKSTTFAPFCYPYVKLLSFVSSLNKCQKLFFFLRKTEILVKLEKSHAFLQFISTCTNYLELIVQLLKRKRNFNIYYYILIHINTY